MELGKLVGGVNSVLPAKEQKTKNDEFGHKMADAVSRDRREIAEVLTAEQLASLKKLIVRRMFLVNLSLADSPPTDPPRSSRRCWTASISARSNGRNSAGSIANRSKPCIGYFGSLGKRR